MQETSNSKKDKFEIYLDEMIKKVHICQEDKQLTSCSKCESFFGCELRDEYVKAVYNSMSKGDTGGFEF